MTAPAGETAGKAKTAPRIAAAIAAATVVAAAVIAAAVIAAAVIAAAVIAGCGSTARPGSVPARRPVSLPLATALATGQTAWAVVPMGAAAGPNLFWQLFVLPAHASRWSLATPPDVATNGAIALGVQSSRSLIAGIHPSLLLRFSPITSTPDGGRTWSTGAPDPGLANVPDALAASPDGSRLIALDRDGSAEQASTRQSGNARANWTTLTSTTALSATPAGRACRLTALTAAAFSPAGSPVLAGNCTRPGVAGIFAQESGTWRAAGPPSSSLPAPMRQQKMQVLRLTRSGTRLTALLQAGTGPTASLITAWANGGRWTLSPPLRLAGLAVTSSSFGSNGAAAVTFTGQHGQYLADPGTSWRPLPAMPPGRNVTLALPAGGGVDVLATDGSVMTAWQLHGGTGGGDTAAATTVGRGSWVKTQATKVPIQYGSSS
jgi:hypothetical protein